MACILWNSNFRKFQCTDFQSFDIHSSSFQEQEVHAPNPADALATVVAAAVVVLMMRKERWWRQPQHATHWTWWSLSCWRSIPRTLLCNGFTDLNSPSISPNVCACFRVCACKISAVHSCSSSNLRWVTYTYTCIWGAKNARCQESKYHTSRLDEVDIKSSRYDAIFFYFFFLLFEPLELCFKRTLLPHQQPSWLCGFRIRVSALLFHHIFFYGRALSHSFFHSLSKLHWVHGWYSSLESRIIVQCLCLCGCMLAKNGKAKQNKAKPRAPQSHLDHIFICC